MQSFKSLFMAGLCLGLINGPAYGQAVKPSGQMPPIGNSAHERVETPDAKVEDFLQLAAKFKNMRSYDQAMRTLEKAHKKFPDNTQVLYQLGLAYIAGGQPEAAVNVLDMLTAIEPDNAMAYNGKAVAFDRAGNHFAAQELYKMALEHDPDAAAILNNLAMSLILDHKAKEAIGILEPLYERAADNPKVRHNLALAYGISGNAAKARELGLQDLNEKEVEDNLKFYEHYSTLAKAPVTLLSKDQQVLQEPLKEIPTPAAKSSQPAEEMQDEEPDTIELAPAAGDNEEMEEEEDDSFRAEER